MKKLTDQFANISHSGDSVDLDSFDPGCLLPEDKTRFWTYPGSLTTPPCYESVTWVLFREPVEVSEAQLNQFRNLASYAKGESAQPSDDLHGHIIENYRPITPQNDRILKASFT